MATRRPSPSPRLPAAPGRRPAGQASGSREAAGSRAGRTGVPVVSPCVGCSLPLLAFRRHLPCGLEVTSPQQRERQCGLAPHPRTIRLASSTGRGTSPGAANKTPRILSPRKAPGGEKVFLRKSGLFPSSRTEIAKIDVSRAAVTRVPSLPGDVWGAGGGPRVGVRAHFQVPCWG